MKTNKQVTSIISLILVIGLIIGCIALFGSIGGSSASSGDSVNSGASDNTNNNNNSNNSTVPGGSGNQGGSNTPGDDGAEPDDPELIAFKFRLGTKVITREFSLGMKWGEYIESSYNDDDLFIKTGDSIMYWPNSSSACVVAYTPSSNDAVNINQDIEDGHIYGECKSSGSSNNTSGGSTSSGTIKDNENSFDIHIHTFKTEVSFLDCTQGGVETKTCVTCGYSEETNKEPSGHLIATMSKKDPTCTVPGFEAYEYCMRCEYKADIVTLPIIDHNLVTLPDKAATCTEVGYTGVKSCTMCDYTLNSETIPALGHNEVAHEDKAATCTETGYENYVTCSRCDYERKTILDKISHTYTEGKCTMCGSEAEIITFYVDGVAYQARSGMSWEEFINSEYNPDYYSVALGYQKSFSINSENTIRWGTSYYNEDEEMRYSTYFNRLTLEEGSDDYETSDDVIVDGATYYDGYNEPQSGGSD